MSTSSSEAGDGGSPASRRDELVLLLEVSQLIVSELDLEKVFDLVVTKARELIDAETVVLPMISETRDSYTYLAAAGTSAGDIRGASFKINIGMCGWVLQNKRALLFGEPTEWWMEEKPAWEASQQSALLVPLMGRQGIIGGLSGIGKAGGGSFTRRDLDLMSLFANQVSVAIENARLFREHHSAISRLEEEVAERGRVETVLQQEKERLAVTLRSIGDGVITTDVEGKVGLVNRVAEKITGWTQAEAAGRPLEEVFRIVDEESRLPLPNPASEALRTGHSVDLSDRALLLSREGAEMRVADSASPIRDNWSRIIGAVLVFRDVTERRKMEEELLKIRKIESVGVLAGGIAHDFNNILTAVIGNISLACNVLDERHDAYPLLKDAEKASLRARDLTHQLLTFSKGGDPVKETASITEVIRESADFVLRGTDIACRYHIADDVRFVDIDRGQMSQVIQNLIINARQAMPEGGRIDVECDNVDSAEGVDIPLPVPGQYVRIAVRDTGTGIPENLLGRIFDPYVSTREDGNGLGLAVTLSIVRKHGGHITVKSRPGEGSTFTIYIPASPGQRPLEAAGRTSPAAAAGKVLVMDDEEMVRNIADRMLAHHGFSTLLAGDGETALRLYRDAMEAGEPVDVVIMDLTVPGGMGGKLAVEELKRIDPDARVIVSSGYSNDPVMAGFRDYGFDDAVAKPFRFQDLIEVVGRVMARGRGPAPAPES